MRRKLGIGFLIISVFVVIAITFKVLFFSPVMPPDDSVTSAPIDDGAVTNAMIDTMAESKLTGALPANVVYVKGFDELQALAKNGSPVHIKLLPGRYEFTEPVKLGNNTIISAQSKITLYARRHIKAFFEISGSSNISIENLIFELDYLNRGIAGLEGLPSKNIVIKNNIFIGNLRHAEFKENQSREAIFIKDTENIQVIDNDIRDTFGGIYALGDKVRIKGNSLFRVNFDNIRVNGEYIQIISNHVIEAGKGSKFHHSSGDVISLLGGSENVIIKDNWFDTGYCYMLWAHAPQTNLTISNNIVKNGVTTGFMIEGATNVVVENNVFDSNLANGLGFINGGENISVVNNSFIANPLLMGDSIISAQVMDNSFSFTEKPLKTGKSVHLENNKIQPLVLSNADVSLDLLMMDTGEVIKKLDFARKNYSLKVDFIISNPSDDIIKFYGFPQIVVTEGRPLERKSRGPNEAGDSGVPGILVPSRFQPTTLSLKPGEQEIFSVLFSDKSELKSGVYYINIPNSANWPDHYYVELRVSD